MGCTAFPVRVPKAFGIDAHKGLCYCHHAYGAVVPLGSIAAQPPKGFGVNLGFRGAIHAFGTGY